MPSLAEKKQECLKIIQEYNATLAEHADHPFFTYMHSIVEQYEAMEKAKNEAIIAGLEDNDEDYHCHGPPPLPPSETVYGFVRNVVSVLLKAPHTHVLHRWEGTTFSQTVKGALLLLIPEITCVEEDNKTTFSLHNCANFPAWAHILFSHTLGVNIHHKTFDAYYCNHGLLYLYV